MLTAASVIFVVSFMVVVFIVVVVVVVVVVFVVVVVVFVLFRDVHRIEFGEMSAEKRLADLGNVISRQQRRVFSEANLHIEQLSTKCCIFR